MSPERVKICTQSRLIRPAFKKVQVVYYLTRNGQLEHPHYLEVTHLANQQLRLKGTNPQSVLDRRYIQLQIRVEESKILILEVS